MDACSSLSYSLSAHFAQGQVIIV
jgi:hypothetical protein